MNIFLPYPEIEKNVLCLDDLRLNKMIIEHGQLLSAAMHVHGGTPPLKPYFLYHPCAKFTMATKGNYEYVLQYYVEMLKEFEFRKDKQHSFVKHIEIFTQGAELIPEGDLQPFFNCSAYKDEEIHSAYRKTLYNKWVNDYRKPKWTKRSRPEFISEYQSN